MKIHLDAYSPTWPDLFNAESERIRDALGPIHLEHIGSTAIEGLSAKPVIDMMAEVRNLDDVMKFVEPLAKLGYVYAPELEKQTSDRKFFQRRIENGVWYHLSFSEATSKYWVEHLSFRDYLRNHPEDRDAYENLKIGLARKHDDNFDAYNADKADYINATIRKALKDI